MNTLEFRMPFHGLVDLGLAGFLLSWFAISAICQVPSKLEKWLRAHDVCSLIPRWHFFAPNPGTRDFPLLYRDRLSDGCVSRWREVPLCKPPRGIAAVWNPGRRHNKAFFDITQELTTTSLVLSDRTALIQLTVPYIAVLNFVSCLPRDYDACDTQFLIMTAVGYDKATKPSKVFVSAVHR